MQSVLVLFLLGVTVRSSFIPECASTCVGEAIDSSLCSSADTACICESRSFLPELHSCIEINCEEEDQEDAIAHTDQFCAAVSSHKQGLRARDAAPEPEPAAAAEAEAYGPPQGYETHRGDRQGWWEWAKQKGGERWGGVTHKENGGNKSPAGYNGGKKYHPTPTKKKHHKPTKAHKKHKPKKTHHKKPHKPTHKKPHKTHKTHKPHKPTPPPYPHPKPTTMKTTTSHSQPNKPHTPISYPTHTYPTHKPHTTKTHKTRPHHTTKTHKPHSYPTHTRYSHTTPVTVY